MASRHSGIKLFLISIVLSGLVPAVSPAEEEGSLFDIVQSVLKETVRNQNGNPGMLGGIFQGVMEGEGGKQLGEMLTKTKGGPIDLIANLASIWEASKFNIATTDESGAKKDLNFDSSILSSMVDLFMTLNKVASKNVDENNNEKGGSEKSSIDWSALLSLAGSMASSQQIKQEAGGLESFLSLIPVLMNTFTGQHNVHSSRVIPHHTHTPFLPPVLENLHEYWDYFSNSEFGKTLWQNSGLSELVNSFNSSKGELQTDKLFESLENNTLRRRWIKSVSTFIAQWMKVFTNPEIQKSYLETAQIVSNGFLKANGYPKESMINLNNPSKSISSLINTVFQRQFNLKVNSEVYVKPVVAYITELFRIGQKKGLTEISRMSEEDIKEKLSETLNNDVIDPILRVNRAYKFALRRPECAKYVICLVNQNYDVTKSGLKPGITKLCSLGASWFIASQGDGDYWGLYQAVVEEQACEKPLEKCSEFHEEDSKATTEYYHNEL